MYMDISKEDIINIMDCISAFGQDASGGMSRLLYTEEWLACQNKLKDKFAQIGMTADFDEVGNLSGKITGTESPDEIIATGSHVDTVVNGGNLDGQLGIIGGYLAVKYLTETYGKPKKTLQVVSMAEEEGSRFPTVFWGSKNLMGIADNKAVAEITDVNGVRFEDAMRKCGFDYKKEQRSSMEQVKAFIELHIEQGNTLEMEQISLGVINGIAGQRRYNITVKGQANHAGTTMMKYRRDVIQVFAKIVNTSIEKVKSIDNMVLTFGKIVVEPNVVNVVPGDALFTMDCRHTDQEVLSRVSEEIESGIKRAAEEMGCTIGVDRWMDEAPIPMDEKVMKVIEEACCEEEIDYKVMHSGAGHDSQIIAPHIPTGMIFVPSINGISHNPAEETKLEDLKKGIDVLAATLYKLAY